MVAAAQIVVAAALALAWVWVLWRPVVHGVLGLFGRRGFDPFAISQSDHPVSELEAAFWGEEPPNARPPEIRRRQLMLATLLAWFASFFLAIAFRGLMVWVFALMTVLVVVHVSAAAVLGGRIIRSRREASHQWEALAMASLRATRVEADITPSEMHLLVQELQASYPIEGAREWHNLVAELIEQEWGATASTPAVPSPRPEPTPAAAAPAAAPAAAAKVEPPVANTTHAPAAPATAEARKAATAEAKARKAAAAEARKAAIAQAEARKATAAEADARKTAAAQAEARKTAAAAQAQAEAPEVAALTPRAGADGPTPAAPRADASGAEAPREHRTAESKRAEPAAETDPLFTRPAGQAPKPRRQKPRPIYIHSQLDEEGFSPPRAVNDQ